MSKAKKIIATVFGSIMGAALAVSSAAAPEGGAVDPSQVVSALSDFSVANVLIIIVAGLGIAVPLVLIWFAFRWIYGKAKGALMGGR